MNNNTNYDSFLPKQTKGNTSPILNNQRALYQLDKLDMSTITQDNLQMKQALPKGITSMTEAVSYHSNQQAVLFRDDVILNIYRNLLSTAIPNTLLVGDTGVGKTGIVEEIARRIANGDTLTKAMFPHMELYELNLTALMANTKLRGELENRLIDIVNFAKENPQAVFFIDEIHQLFSSQESSENNYSAIAEHLKPALSRNQMKIIGATTTQEAKSIENNPAMKRRMNTVYVPELTNEQTALLLEQKQHHIIQEIQEKHNEHIAVENGLIDYIIRTANHRMIGSKRPENAIRLFDLTISEAIIHENQKALKENSDLFNLQANGYFQKELITVTKEHVDATFKTVYGFDTTPSIETFEKLKETLKSSVIGQEEAINQVIKTIECSTLELTERKRPISLMFTGASGTGKTKTAKVLADGLYPGHKNNFLVLNMTQYAEENSLSELLGASAGLVLSNSNAEMPLDSLITNPYQVVLLDEFEKAHPVVQKLFMQALDEGFITTKRNQRVDFSKAIVIATTNALTATSHSPSIGFNSLPKEVEKQQLTASLSDYFPVELINRFETILMYQPIAKADYRNIIISHYNELVKQIHQMSTRYQITPSFIDMTAENVPSFIDTITNQSYDRLLNGRPAQRAVRSFLEEIIVKRRNEHTFDLTAL